MRSPVEVVSHAAAECGHQPRAKKHLPNRPAVEGSAMIEVRSMSEEAYTPCSPRSPCPQ